MADTEQLTDTERAQIARAERTAKHRAKHGDGWAAVYVLQQWTRRPWMTRTEMIARLCAHFDCSEHRAADSIKSARLMLEERARDPDLADRVVDAWWTLYHDARSVQTRAKGTGDLTNERKAIDTQAHVLERLTKHLGLGAPERVEITGGVTVIPAKFAKLSDDQLQALAELDVEDAQETTAP